MPTRVTDHSATVVDNIFTNNLDKSLIRGNIISDFSDHYSQFISIQNQTFDLKSIIIYKRDYSNFSEKSFRDDVSIQNFCNDLGDVNEQFQDFYFKLGGGVDRHAPLKKLTLKEIKLNQKPWINHGFTWIVSDMLYIPDKIGFWGPANKINKYGFWVRPAKSNIYKYDFGGGGK